MAPLSVDEEELTKLYEEFAEEDRPNLPTIGINSEASISR